MHGADLVGVRVADAAEEVGIREARFSVWFSLRRRAAKARELRAQDLHSAGIERLELAAPRRRWMLARFFVLASVRMRVPLSKSNAASPTLPGMGAPAGFHLKRPATMRWITR